MRTPGIKLSEICGRVDDDSHVFTYAFEIFERIGQLVGKFVDSNDSASKIFNSFDSFDFVVKRWLLVID